MINLDHIFNLIPNSENFISGKNVVYIIGLCKLIIMFFSFNSEIISLSKYYRFTVTTIIILAIISIALNLILIPIYGMIGAAFASLISILIFNIVKHIFIKIKMNISPFSMNSFKVILIGIILFTFDNYLMPTLDNDLISILYKSTFTSAVYISVIYFLKISPKLNGMIKSFFKN